MQLPSICNLAAVLLAYRVAQFIYATGEYRHIQDLLAHTGRCERHVPEHYGFEDFATLDGGRSLVAMASDHSHFAFKFGTSMRDTLSQRNGTHTVHAYVLRGWGLGTAFGLRLVHAAGWHARVLGSLCACRS